MKPMYVDRASDSRVDTSINITLLDYGRFKSQHMGLKVSQWI